MIPAIVGATVGAPVGLVFDNVRTAEPSRSAIVAAFIILLANGEMAARRPDRSGARQGPLVVPWMGCVGPGPALPPSTWEPGVLAVLVLLAHFDLREANAIKVTTPDWRRWSAADLRGRVRVDWRVAVRGGQHRGGAARSAAGARPNAAKWVFRLLIAALLIECDPPVMDSCSLGSAPVAVPFGLPGPRPLASVPASRFLPRRVTSGVGDSHPGDTLDLGGRLLRRLMEPRHRGRGQLPSLRSWRCAGRHAGVAALTAPARPRRSPP